MAEGALTHLQSQRDPKLSVQLRPNNLEEVIGQPRAVKLLQLMMRSGQLSDSVLFVGPPGMGKTTLARMTTQNKLWTVLGSSIQKPEDASYWLRYPKAKQVLFIDEIHSMRRVASELFYTTMEDGILFERTPMKLPDFQIVAATTEPGKLATPLRERFGQVIYLNYYSDDEIAQILERSTGIMKMETSDDHIEDIAKRSRGVPRIANRLLRRIKDFGDEVSTDMLDELWGLLEIDSLGLEPLDKSMVKYLQGRDRPTGVNTIARVLGLDKSTIESMVEPFLIRKGLLEIVPGGRQLTALGLAHAV